MNRPRAYTQKTPVVDWSYHVKVFLAQPITVETVVTIVTDDWSTRPKVKTLKIQPFIQQDAVYFSSVNHRMHTSITYINLF